MFSRVAALRYMSLFIAGATIIGLRQVSASAVTMLSAIPQVILAIVLALAGATQEDVAVGSELEVGDRIVLRALLIREDAAGRVALELDRQHRRAGDALVRGLADEVHGCRASARRARRGRP